MNHHADANRDLEQEALEALEDFRQGIADAEQIRLLAWITGLDDRVIDHIAHGRGRRGE